MFLEIALIIVVLVLLVWVGYLVWPHLKTTEVVVTPAPPASAEAMVDRQMQQELAVLNSVNTQDILAQNIDPATKSSHAQYADEIYKRTSTASKHADHDTPSFSNWVAWRPDRVPVSSEARQQFSYDNDEYQPGRIWRG